MPIKYRSTEIPPATAFRASKSAWLPHLSVALVAVALIGGAAAKGVMRNPSTGAVAMVEPALTPAVAPHKSPALRPAGAALSHRNAETVEYSAIRIAGIAGNDLNASLRAAGVPDTASAEYINALASRISLSRGISVADRFDLVIAHRRTAAGEQYGRLVYAGLDRVGASDLQLLRWTVGGRRDWVDESGSGTTLAGLAWPVAASVSSGFGMRLHPLLGFMRFHRGIDLRARWGAPIAAAADGRVISAGWSGGYGRQVRILHAGGIATSYSHMSGITAAPGQSVRQGQLIGFVGSTGLSTGPHLHYEVSRNGVPVNPLGIKLASTTKVEQRDRDAFRSTLRQMLLIKPNRAIAFS